MRYVVKAWLLALIPSILLSIIVSLVAAKAEPVEIPLRGDMLPLMILLLVIIGPLIETLLMTPVVLGVNRIAGAGPAVVTNAAVWGVLHSLQRPIWGLGGLVAVSHSVDRAAHLTPARDRHCDPDRHLYPWSAEQRDRRPLVVHGYGRKRRRRSSLRRDFSGGYEI